MCSKNYSNAQRMSSNVRIVHAAGPFRTVSVRYGTLPYRYGTVPRESRTFNTLRLDALRFLHFSAEFEG